MIRVLFFLLVLGGTLRAQLKDLRPGFNLFTPQQDIQMGKEAAGEVEKTMPVVKNEELSAYLSKVGARLAKSPHAGTFPFSFSVINDKSINAFALPGGPVFVHTGLIAALDNESQLAGVLAHEMSHVALRHGTNQASKANLLQLGALLASSGLGDQSVWGKLGQLGIGLGAQSVLLKYSRNAERDADLNGARIMNEAGYDPVQMAVFFQKLEAQGQKDNSFVANFLSDHPTPGNRVAYVQDQNKYLPKKQYSELDPGALPRIKNVVSGLPPPPPPKTAAGTAGAAAPPDIRPSSQYKEFKGKAFTLSYPDNWQAFGQEGSDNVTVAPKEALLADAKGQTQIGYGFIVSYYVPENGKADLRRDTDNLTRQLQQENAGMQRTSAAQKTVRVGGQNGLLTALESNSPYRGERESDTLVTVARPEGLFYIVFIVPKSEQGSVQKTVDDVMRSVKF
jgi:beta-barrel assembly-enhancing protease